MKRILFFALATLFLFHSNAQMDIHIRVDGAVCDSIKIQSFNWQKKSGTNLAMPFSKEVVFKGKQPLKPGMYWITADSSNIGSFLVSNEKKQKLTINIDHGILSFESNPENTHYVEYLAKMNYFQAQMASLDQEFNHSKKLPQYMLRTLVDSLTARAQRIAKAQSDYEQQVIQDNPNTVLASIVAINKATPDLPTAYYNDPRRAQAFVVEHYFDNFPWNDPRFFNTPVAEKKFKNFCEMIYQWDRPDLDTFVVKALQAARINETSYLLFFDRLERDLGFYMSNYKVEHTYIKLLQEVLTLPNLEEKRKVYYEHELATINKNVDGSIATDFRFVDEHGDTSHLHGFQSEYTLLLFHNPTCHTCLEVRRRLAQNDVLNDAIASGRLNVLTIYVENDAKIWQYYIRGEAAKNHRHGWNFDQTIEEKSLYETRTIPYMYLLDKDKRVIRKNILVDEINDYLTFLGIVRP